ncbi:MAG: hypothetical protein ACRYG8_40400, partial [Janthinobacterium lividum]
MYAFSKFIPSYMVKTFGEIGATGLLHLSILRTLKAALLNGNFKVWVCRKSHVVLKRRSVSGTGHLIIVTAHVPFAGQRWRSAVRALCFSPNWAARTML